MALPREAFGSPFGWLIAAVLAALLGVTLFVVHSSRAGTATTALYANATLWQTAPVPVDLVAVRAECGAAGANMLTRDDDAGEAYRSVADRVLQSRPTRLALEDFLKPNATRPATEPRLVDLFDQLRRAAASTSATLFEAQPKTLINYDRQLPHLDTLEQLGQAMLKQASLFAGQAQRGDGSLKPDDARDEARRLFLATAILGQRLQQEQLIYRQYSTGGELLQNGLGGLVALAKVENNTNAAAALTQQREALRSVMNGPVLQMWEGLSAINNVERSDDNADVHAGDVLAIAGSESAHPMWRVEAILRTGKLRHDATRISDAERADRVL